ncbi:hypothetical protein [Arenimonas fontis]|uniref:Uncharacterized protein n=1 Tax=Arenimonas fontis TaxID=2608255 RepID=A0A5B2ZF95_9GAMM|nr:hypothetical protein [Arenimonas fontis]KAA2285772.1 hypothetical protein F0415_03875 [Arenimonas fontis]
MRTALPRLVILAGGLALSSLASAYTVNIAPANPRAVYLRVGDGLMSGGNYNAGGTPVSGGAVNRVLVTVPAGSVGNGVPIAMGTEGSPRLTSDYDGYLFCNPGQIYIGGFYRTTSNGGWRAQPARLLITAPANLVSADGHTIPISEISWTTSGNGDTGPQPIPAGTLSAGQNQLTTFPRNSWRESCMSFTYANQNLVAAGTYDATVTFTLAQP